MIYMLKAIIFDLDDTLYEYEEINKEAINALCAYTCNRYNISISVFLEVFRKAREENKQILGQTGASHNRMLYCQKMLEYLNIPPAEAALELYETYWGYMLEHMELREGILELLQYCKEHSIKIGICSDLTAHIQHRKIRKLGISSLIDKIVTSEEAGIEKPASIMYEMILNKLGVKPEEALFIGDSLEKDIKGAKKVGMKALWFHIGKNYEGAQFDMISSFREAETLIYDGK